jgi:DNA-binding transcriptional LysR family regulator
MKNIAAVDLNLMTAFEAMMEEQHVSRAASRIGLAQPSMSNALSRLRALFDDPLFVRVGGSMKPTERARMLAPLIKAALDNLRIAVNDGGSFDPESSTQIFRLATTDYGEMLVLPELMRRLRMEAPGVVVRSLPFDRSSFERDLEEGKLNAGLTVIEPKLPRTRIEKFWEERFVCIAREGHPALTPKAGADAYTALDLDTFLSLDHALVVRGGAAKGAVDTALSRMGRERRIGLTVANFTTLIFEVAQSDFIAAVAERLAIRMAPLAGFAIHALPLQVGNFTMSLAWHQSTDADLGQQWFRRHLRDVRGAITPSLA